MMNHLMLKMLPLALGLLAGADSPSTKGTQPKILNPTSLAFGKMISLTDEIARPDDRAYALGRIARYQAASGDKMGSQSTFALAIRLAEKLSPDESRYQPHILASVGNDQFEAGDRAGSIATYRDTVGILNAKPLKSGQFDISSYMNLINYQIKAGDEVGARETFEQARKGMANAKDKSFDRYIGLWTAQLAALLGDFDAVFRAIAANEANPIPTLLDFKIRALESICRAVERLAPANGRAVLEHILDEPKMIIGIDPMNVPGLYVDIAEAAAKIGAIDLAFRALDSVKNDPAQPEAFQESAFFHRGRILTLIAQAETKAGQTDQAKATLDRAIKVAETMNAGPSQNGVFSFIFGAQMEMGDFAAAARPLKGQRKEVSSGFQFQLARIQEKAGDFAAARKTLMEGLANAETYRRDLKPEPPSQPGENDLPPQSFEEKQDFASSQIATIKAELGDFESALTLAQNLKTKLARRNALAAIASAYGRFGDIDAAATWIRGLKDPEERSWCVNPLIGGLGERYAPVEQAIKPKR